MSDLCRLIWCALIGLFPRQISPNQIYSIASPPDRFAERIRTDLAKWGKVIRDANVKVE
jgi:hypothetical protein